MFLTAKDDTSDRVAGLAAGGDDYVTKPFSMEEVLIRLHRLVQRSGVTASGQEVIVVGDLVAGGERDGRRLGPTRHR